MGLGKMIDFTLMFIVTITFVLNFSPSAYSQTFSPPAPPPSPEENFGTNSSPPSPEENFGTNSTPAPATPPSPSTNSTPPPPTPTTPTSAPTNSTPNTGFSVGAKAGIGTGGAMGALLVSVGVRLVGVRINCGFYFCKKNKVQDEQPSLKRDEEKGESALPSGVARYTGHEVREE